MSGRRASPVAPLLVGSTVFACGGERAEWRADDAIETYPLPAIEVSTRVVFRHEGLGFPLGLALLPSRSLVVLNAYTAPHVFVIDRVTGDLRQSFGAHGHGPDEFMFTFSAVASPDEDLLWISDPGQGRLAGVPVRDDGTLRPTDFELVRFERTVFRHVLVLPGRRFVVSDFSGRGRFVAVDRQGRVVDAYARPPSYGSDTPSAVGALAHAEILARHPHGGTVAAAGVRTGSLLLFSGEFAAADTAEVPFPTVPEIEVTRPRDEGLPGYRMHSPYGYLDLAATPRHLFALYSGRRLRDHGEEASAGSELHVYTWTGELVAILRMDTALRAVAVDPADGIAYGTRWEEDPAVVSFELPGSLATDTREREGP